MEKRRRLIIDRTIVKATFGRFTGDDEHDGKTPPITAENFSIEFYRYFAKGLRARWIRLSSAKLRAEARVVRAHFKKPSELTQLAERFKREEDARAHRQRQAEFAKMPRVDAAIVDAIVAAARHYRKKGMTAAQAWDALYKTPFETEDGYTVKIEGPKLRRLDQRLRVISRDGRQQKRPIGFARFQQKHWPAGT
jgi:hypothetical protein